MKYIETSQYIIKKFKDLVILKLKWDSEVLPGQFFMIGSDFSDTILNRPFSVSDFENNEITFRIKVIGKFTKFLANIKENVKLRIIGPLGKGIFVEKLASKYNSFVLIGGGIGIAPLIYLNKVLLKKGLNTHFIYGAPSKYFLHYAIYYNSCIPVIYTEDGSCGNRGFPHFYLKNFKNEKNICVISCGPVELYKSLKKEKNFDVYIFPEQNMGCGFGACLSCVIDTASGYKKICIDGPVFPLSEINL